MLLVQSRRKTKMAILVGVKRNSCLFLNPLQDLPTTSDWFNVQFEKTVIG